MPAAENCYPHFEACPSPCPERHNMLAPGKATRVPRTFVPGGLAVKDLEWAELRGIRCFVGVHALACARWSSRFSVRPLEFTL